MNSKRRVVSSSRSAAALAEGAPDVDGVVDVGVVAAAVLHASVQLVVTAVDDVRDGAAEERLSVALARLLADEGANSKLGEETYTLMVRHQCSLYSKRGMRTRSVSLLDRLADDKAPCRRRKHVKRLEPDARIASCQRVVGMW